MISRDGLTGRWWTLGPETPWLPHPDEWVNVRGNHTVYSWMFYHPGSEKWEPVFSLREARDLAKHGYVLVCFTEHDEVNRYIEDQRRQEAAKCGQDFGPDKWRPNY